MTRIVVNFGKIQEKKGSDSSAAYICFWMVWQRFLASSNLVGLKVGNPIMPPLSRILLFCCTIGGLAAISLPPEGSEGISAVKVSPRFDKKRSSTVFNLVASYGSQALVI